jgi:uncharacterized coiled-coil protein SlyX
MTEWVAIVQAGGTVGVLAIFGYLFWTGQIVSKGTVDKIVAVYEAQSKVLSNGFLSKLEASTARQCDAVDGLVIAIRESVSESRQSRDRMQEVVRQLTGSLSAIEAKQNGTAAPRRRKK